MRSRHAPIVILGGGLAGMAAAIPLGQRCLVLERDARPGGLVTSLEADGYWFDTVLHLLHFQTEEIKREIRGWVGPDLTRIDRQAWVETAAGRAPYPLQQNLSFLDADTIVACLMDLIACSANDSSAFADLKDRMRSTFGDALCDLFFIPYNEKMWKRPLEELPADSLAWTIPRPDLRQIVTGAIAPDADTNSYNADGWYPIPPAGAPVRGMEVLSRAMA